MPVPRPWPRLLSPHRRRSSLAPRAAYYSTTPSPGTGAGLTTLALGLATGVVLTSVFFKATAAPAKPLGAAGVPVVDPPARTKPAIDAQTLAQTLAKALGEDKVSTDHEVLHVHGYSENDYHPGAPALPPPCRGC